MAKEYNFTKELEDLIAAALEGGADPWAISESMRNARKIMDSFGLQWMPGYQRYEGIITKRAAQ